MIQIPNRLVGETVKFYITLPNSIASYSSIGIKVITPTLDRHLLAEFAKSDLVIDNLNNKKAVAVITSAMTEKAFLSLYNIELIYSTATETKKVICAFIRFVDEYKLSKENIDGDISLLVNDGSDVSIVITSEYSESKIVTVNEIGQDVNGNIAIDTDDIPEGATNKYVNDQLIAEINASIATKEPAIVAPTENQDYVFWNGRKTFTPIAIGSGGSAAWIYPSTLTSVTNSGYKQLVYNAESGETILSTTATNGQTLIGRWIFDQPLDTNVIPLGVWNVAAYRSISNASGISYIRAVLLLYHIDNTTTVVYTANGNNINDTVLTQSMPYEATVPQINCATTDKLGLELYLVTDRNQPTTLQLAIGDGHGFRFSTPLALRHDQTRDKNGNPNFQHIDNDQKYNGALPTGVANPSPISGSDISTTAKVVNEFDALKGEVKNRSIFSKVLDAINEPYKFFVKSSNTSFQICSHNTVNHSTYAFTKDANDDFWKLSTCFVGTVGVSTASPYQAAPANRTGTFVGTVGNLYTTTVGDSFTLSVVGEKISFYSYCDNRGGMWEFVVDGNYNNKIYLSCYNATAGQYTQTIVPCLSNGQHTVVGTFRGVDPNNAPSGGTARGWLYYTDQVSVNGTLNTYTYNNNNMTTQLTYGDSNKEIAMQLTVGNENNFFPDHGVGTAFNRSSHVIKFDGFVNNLETIPTAAHIGFNQFNFDQFLYYRLPIAGNVAQVDIKYKFVDKLNCKSYTTFLQGGTLFPYYPLMIPANGTTSTIKSNLGTLITPVGNSAYTYYDNDKKAFSDFSIMANTSNDAIFATRVLSKGYIKLSNVFLWDRPTAPKIYYETPSKLVSAGDTITHEIEFICANIKNAHTL